jgi:hypothetical protein
VNAPRPKTGAAEPSGPPPVTYRVVELPGGQLLPIEVRLGHRVLRTIAPESREGRKLIEEGRVERVQPSRESPTDH